jgi:hypothetical protein
MRQSPTLNRERTAGRLQALDPFAVRQRITLQLTEGFENPALLRRVEALELALCPPRQTDLPQLSLLRAGAQLPQREVLAARDSSSARPSPHACCNWAMVQDQRQDFHAVSVHGFDTVPVTRWPWQGKQQRLQGLAHALHILDSRDSAGHARRSPASSMPALRIRDHRQQLGRTWTGALARADGDSHPGPQGRESFWNHGRHGMGHGEHGRIPFRAFRGSFCAFRDST